MCLPYRKSLWITEADVKEGADFERDGFWFLVHFVKNGQVYFIRGRSGEDEGFMAQRCPIADFVRVYNAGKDAV